MSLMTESGAEETPSRENSKLSKSQKAAAVIA